MSRLPVPSNVPAARSVALSDPRTWLGLDGIEGSVDPTLNLIHDWGDDVVIEKAGDRIFNFTVRKKIDKYLHVHVGSAFVVPIAWGQWQLVTCRGGVTTVDLY